MTSVIRSFYKRQEGLTMFMKPESPCYYSADIDSDRLFPFTYTKGVLNISYSDNSFKAQMVDTTEQAPDSETNTSIRILGSPRMVTSLGDNFKEYIRAWRDATIDAGSPIELYKPAQVIRVQEGDVDSIDANNGSSFQITTKAPASDEYITGTSANVYRTTYIFKTPLTFTTVEGGVTQYITFRTMLDQE
jgi:hypothetical protein